MYSYRALLEERSPLKDQKINAHQAKLARELLILISKRMCHLLTMATFENYYIKSDKIREHLIRSYSEEKQVNALKGALINHEYISSWSITCRCLDMWGIIEYTEAGADSPYSRMNLDAEHIKALVKQTDVNMQLYGIAVAAFFQADIQTKWEYTIADRRVEIDKSLVTYFQDSELVKDENGKLTWQNEIDQYLIGGYPTSVSSFYGLDEKFDDPIEESAEGFFNRIQST